MLLSHPVIRSEVAVEMQMGFPFLYQDQGKLCLRYLPHREVVEDGRLVFYAPAYRLEMCYPFKHFMGFVNYALSGNVHGGEGIAEVALDWMLENARRDVEQLYGSCDAVLDEQVRLGGVRPETMDMHHQAFEACVEKMGLRGIYGG